MEPRSGNLPSFFNRKTKYPYPYYGWDYVYSSNLFSLEWCDGEANRIVSYYIWVATCTSNTFHKKSFGHEYMKHGTSWNLSSWKIINSIRLPSLIRKRVTRIRACFQNCHFQWHVWRLVTYRHCRSLLLLFKYLVNFLKSFEMVQTRTWTSLTLRVIANQ